MPYIDKNEIAVDSKGNPIHVGDILERIDLDPSDEPWRYHVCVEHDETTLAVRDLNAWNIGMCELGLDGNVINLGHYSKNPQADYKP